MNIKTMNLKNALKLSLLLSLFWYLIRFLGVWGLSDVISSLVETTPTLTDMHMQNGKQFFINVISYFTILSLQFSIFNKKWKFNKKFWVSITCSILILFFFVVFVTSIYYIFGINYEEKIAVFPSAFFILAFAIIVSTITVLITSLFYITGEREKTIVENQRLLTENIRSRYETLKNQVNPHFLFNSLNTLNGLIGLNNDKAKDFLQQLSSVLRYSIQNRENTTLNDELVFTEAFCILMNIRYGQSLNIEYHIDDKYRGYLIIPLSLQMLVENAIKHNTISNRYPLTITIETTDNDTVRVWNRIQLKNEGPSSEGIGLANINERYKILYQKEITISASNGIFSVEIPLIKDVK